MGCSDSKELVSVPRPPRTLVSQSNHLPLIDTSRAVHEGGYNNMQLPVPIKKSCRSQAELRLWALFDMKPPTNPVLPPYVEQDPQLALLFSIDFQPREEHQTKFERISPTIVDPSKFQSMIEEANTYFNKQDWKNVALKYLDAMAYGSNFWSWYTLGANLPSLNQIYLAKLALERTQSLIVPEVEKERPNIKKVIGEHNAKMQERDPIKRQGRVCVKYWELHQQGIKLSEEKKYPEAFQKHELAMQLAPRYFNSPYQMLCLLLYSCKEQRKAPRMLELLQKVLDDESVRSKELKTTSPETYKWVVEAIVTAYVLVGDVEATRAYLCDYKTTFVGQYVRARRITVDIEYQFKQNTQGWGLSEANQFKLKVTLPMEQHKQVLEWAKFEVDDKRTVLQRRGGMIYMHKPAGVPIPESLRIAWSVHLEPYCSFERNGLLPVEAYTGSDPYLLKKLTYDKLDDEFRMTVKNLLAELPAGTPVNEQYHFLLLKMQQRMKYTTSRQIKNLTEGWQLANGDCGNFAALACGMAIAVGIPAKTTWGYLVSCSVEDRTHVVCLVYSSSRGEWLFVEQMYDLYGLRSNVVLQTEEDQCEKDQFTYVQPTVWIYSKRKIHTFKVEQLN